MAAIVFTSVFFEYFVVWYFKYLIIGIKGYLQKAKLFFLGILSHAEIPVNGKMAISTSSVPAPLFSRDFFLIKKIKLRNRFYASKDENITLCVDLTRNTLFHILQLK